MGVARGQEGSLVVVVVVVVVDDAVDDVVHVDYVCAHLSIGSIQAEHLIVNDATLDHEYLAIEGLQSFTDASTKFILGKDSPAVQEKRVRFSWMIHQNDLTTYLFWN